MAMKAQYPEATVKKALKMCKSLSQVKVAELLNVPRETLRHWIKYGFSEAKLTRKQILDDLVDQMKVYGPAISCREFETNAAHPKAYVRSWPSFHAFRADGVVHSGITAEDATRASRQRRREQDIITDLQQRLKLAEREVNATDDLRHSVFNLAAQRIDPPAWTFAPPKKGDSVPGIPVLFGSDFQWGEVIKANELDGINAFNNKIAGERYRRLIERTIDLCFGHMVNPKYPGIIYLRGGDMISGDIHQELRETNDLQSIPACIDLIEHEAAGIKALADKFGKVWIISVPGNHGRTTIKPHAKKYVETNYDYLIATMLEREFRGDARIEFMTPMSGDARFKVYDWHFVLTHGDRIGSSGGQGFIGPAATITRGMKKLVDYYAGLRLHVDWCLVGHFHTAMELEYGFSNGSLPGYSEYAKTFRARPQSPTQWLFFVHPKNGVTARWKILLDTKARMAMTNDPVALAA